MDPFSQLDAMLARTEAEVSISPGSFQDLLFDLWGATRDTPAQPVVERWLSLTVERQLFSADEVADALRTIRSLAEGVAAGG